MRSDATPTERDTVDRGAQRQPSPGPLRCLGGKPAPEGLADDLRALFRLPAPALKRMGDVLGPCLADPLPPDVEARLDAFCRTHEIAKDDLARPLKACRFVLREAVRANCGAEALASDLAALCADAPQIGTVLAGVYEAASARLHHERHDLLQGMLADHGNLLVDVDWRRDAVEASSRVLGHDGVPCRGPDARVRVALLTLRYRDGDETKKITLQVLPETLRRLRSVIDQIAL